MSVVESNFSFKQYRTLAEFQILFSKFSIVSGGERNIDHRKHVDAQAYCRFCERLFSDNGDAVVQITCSSCNTTLHEQAGIYLTVSLFKPGATDVVAVHASPWVRSILQRLTLGKMVNGEPADYVLIDDPRSAVLMERQIADVYGKLLAGGGVIWACADAVPTESLWTLLGHMRNFGFADVSLVEVDLALTDGSCVSQFFMAARRSAASSVAVVRRQTRSPVSVVIPLYNHEKYIAAALESVFTQSRPPAEVIVIDDGSRDNSADIARRLCREFDGAITWKQENRGAHNTINCGVHRATQSIVAILNSDDIYGPVRLEKSIDRMNETGAAIMTSPIEFINEDGKLIHNAWYHNALDYWHRIGNSALALLNGNFVMTTSNLILKRRVFENIGLFRNFRYAHDLDFFIRALAKGYEIHSLSEPMLKYRYHSTNTISENHTKVRAEWAYICAQTTLNCTDALAGRLSKWEFLGELNTLVETHNLSRGVLLILQAITSCSSAEQDYSSIIDVTGFEQVLHRSLN